MQEYIQKIKDSLSSIYSDSETISLTRLIMENVTGQSFIALYLDKSKQLTAVEKQKAEKIIARLRRFEPIQYILGETEFYGLSFVVDENVLIPRPETEELVELIISENNIENPHILDIGTGSGCIAISLRKSINKSVVEAWDFSESALTIANNNAKLNKVEVSFKKIDVLNDIIPDTDFDVIVSNPPYVLDSEKIEMNLNVLDYEPHSALFVPDSTPLLFYARIADIAKKQLKNLGRLYFEINQKMGQATIVMLEEKGFSNIKLKKDISGNDRIIEAQLDRDKL